MHLSTGAHLMGHPKLYHTTEVQAEAAQEWKLSYCYWYVSAVPLIFIKAYPLQQLQSHLQKNEETPLEDHQWQ